MSHRISRCTAIAANDKSTRTIGIAVIVMPNSAELWATMRIKSWIRLYSDKRIDGRGNLSLNYLHGDADKEEKVKFKEADDNLVPSVHCYRIIALDRIEV